MKKYRIPIILVICVFGLIRFAFIQQAAKNGSLENLQTVNRVQRTNLNRVRKAKTFLRFPPDIHAGGKSLQEGVPFGSGEFTEANLMACMKGVDSLSELDVGGESIVVGKIGELPRYE